MNKNIILKVTDLHKSFGGIAATNGITLDVRQNKIHAIIGPNGAGKTTLISQLAGSLLPDTGTIHFLNKEITWLPEYRRALLGFARSFQMTRIFPEMSVLDNVALAVQAHAGHSYRFWKAAQADKKLREPALEALAHVGMSNRANQNAGAMSHGEHRQLEIAMALATKPKLLLLDEPMAGMSTDESVQMVAILKKLKGQYTILLVEHDMDAVFALADRITVLVYGRVIASDTPAAIRANPNVRKAYLGDEELTDA